MAYRKAKEEEAGKFKDLMKKDIDRLNISNMKTDLDYINSDESRQARNEEWVKSLKKDFYLEETMFIMKDMIESEPSFTNIMDKIRRKG